MYQDLSRDTILRLSDGAFIPKDEMSRDYQEYLEWLSLGNSPDPYVAPEVSYKEKRKLEYPGVDEFVGALMDSGLINFDHFSELKDIQEKRLEVKAKYPKEVK